MKLGSNKKNIVVKFSNYQEREKIILQLVVHLITKMDITIMLCKERDNGYFSPNKRVKVNLCHTLSNTLTQIKN